MPCPNHMLARCPSQVMLVGALVALIAFLIGWLIEDVVLSSGTAMGGLHKRPYCTHRSAGDAKAGRFSARAAGAALRDLCGKGEINATHGYEISTTIIALQLCTASCGACTRYDRLLYITQLYMTSYG